MKRALNIILADDDEDDRIFFEIALQENGLGLQFTTVENGLQLLTLLNRLDSAQPDIVFLDLNMPVKSGFDCLTEIRNEPKLQKIPVVIISTSNEPSHIEQTYNGGADYYICKPNTFKELKQAILISLSADLGPERVRVSKDNFILNPLP